jgi:hypothetical protein
MLKLVAISAALLLLAACEKSEKTVTVTDSQTGKQADVTTSASGDTTTVRTADGTFTSQTGENVQANLPDFVPVYPGAKAIASVSGQGAEGGGAMTSFEAADPPAKVIGFYKEAMVKAGYKVQAEMTTPQMNMVAGNKGDGQAWQVMAQTKETGSTFQVIVGQGSQ